MVIGNEWDAGNLSYHLTSRPEWYSLDQQAGWDKALSIIEKKQGYVFIGDIVKEIPIGLFSGNHRGI